jgi:hypothetical protein
MILKSDITQLVKKLPVFKETDDDSLLCSRNSDVRKGDFMEESNNAEI